MAQRQRRSWGYIRRERSGRFRASYKTAPNTPYVNAPHTFETRRDAERWLDRTRVDLERGEHRDPRTGAETVKVFGEAFISDHAVRLARSTAYANDLLWANHIRPAFGAHRLRDVRTSEVRAWLADLTRAGLAPSTVRHAYGLLSQVLSAAVDDGEIPVNPCVAARRSLPRLPEPDPVTLTPEQVTAVIEAMPDDPWRLITEVQAWAGLRIGEALALRRRSVNLLRNELVISEAVTEVNGHQRVGETKVHQQGTVSLPGSLADRLAAYLAAHPDATPAAYLFTSRNGTPIRYKVYRRHWDRAASAAGFPGLTPHALRASHGSWVAHTDGVMAAAARLRHSNASITTRHYARVMPGTDVEVAAHLDILMTARRTGETATA